MKKLLIVSCLCMALPVLVLAQLSGPLSGIIGPGSYTVVDSIYVEAGQSLIINAGTEFLFNGAFGFGIAGELHAVGSAADSIKFMPNTGVPFWSGIEFTSSASSNSQLEYCLITGSNDMGIFLNYGSATISHCTFTMNSSVDMGGGIYSYYSNSSISHCVFGFNTALHGGGMVLRFTAPTQVDNLVFYGNNATYGGAMAQYFVSGFALTNCLFYQNSGNQGGAIRFSSSPSETHNCTFTENTASDGAALFIINQVPTANNIIAWGNIGPEQILVYAGGFTCTYSDVQGGFPGTGNIDEDPLFVTAPDGDYYLSQVAAGQPATSLCVDAGDPISPMITGTTRTDGIQDADIVDMGYHYAVVEGPPPPDLSVTLTPHNPPIQIPSGGGSFQFDVAIENTTASPITADAWIEAIPPGGTAVSLIVRTDITFPASATITRPDLTQNVPAGAPPGMYTYVCSVGEIFVSTIDFDQFTFEKLATGEGLSTVNDWNLSGWEEEEMLAAATPGEFALHGAHPNPFNPATTIGYELPEACKVTLRVFDISGRLVAELINGWRDAGIHEVSWNASGLASGIYIYRIQTEKFSAVRKMMLIK